MRLKSVPAAPTLKPYRHGMTLFATYEHKEQHTLSLFGNVAAVKFYKDIIEGGVTLFIWGVLVVGKGQFVNVVRRLINFSQFLKRECAGYVQFVIYHKQRLK